MKTVTVLCLCFVAMFSPMAKAEPPAPAASLPRFYSATEGELRDSLKLRAPNSGDDLERTVMDVEAGLDRITGFRTPVTIAENGKTISHPETGISVSRAELDEISHKAGVREYHDFIRWIMAHEKAHQIQYREYGKERVLSASEEERQVYEIQADILGAKYLSETFAGRDGDQKKAIEDALEASFQMGTTEYSLATHGSHEGRRTAVRLGMAAGMITNFANLPHPGSMSAVNELSRKLDVLPGETTLPWSLRVARRIAHFRREASVSVALSDQDIQWNKDPNEPVVNFRLTYENLGDRPIDLDMEVYCALVSRADQNDTKQWLKYDVQNFRGRISPREKFVAQGRLIWGGNWPVTPERAAELMPRLIFPPSPTALASYDFGGATSVTANRALEPAAKQGLAVGTGEDAEQLGLALLQIISHAEENFSSLRGGAGRKDEDSVAFPCSVAIPGAVNTKIVTDSDSTSVDARLYRSADQASARRRFEEEVSRFTTALGGWKKTRRSYDGKYSLSDTCMFTKEGQPASVRLRLTLPKNPERTYAGLVDVYVEKRSSNE